MEITVHTSDPGAVTALGVAQALQDKGYFVLSVTVIDPQTGWTTSSWSEVVR